MKRQVSKKKLLKWLEEFKEITETGAIISFDKLEDAINSGDLDMTKDWRVHKDEM